MLTPLFALSSAFLLAAAAPASGQDCSAPSAPMPCGRGVATNSSPPAAIVPNTEMRAAATPAPSIIRPAQPRADPAAYVSVADYPESAIRAREEGIVRFTLTVGPNGRVTGCTITQSSGSSALDSASCRLMRSRARFTPAVDSTGNPAASRVYQQLTWTLPAGE